MAQQYLVLDIGGTFIKYAIMDHAAQFVHQGKVPAVTKSERGTIKALKSVRDAVADFEVEGVAPPSHQNTLTILSQRSDRHPPFSMSK